MKNNICLTNKAQFVKGLQITGPGPESWVMEDSQLLLHSMFSAICVLFLQKAVLSYKHVHII